MKIYEIIARDDIETLKQIANKYKFNPFKKKKGNYSDYLGDSVENLMKHNSYKRVNRRVKQTKFVQR